MNATTAGALRGVTRDLAICTEGLTKDYGAGHGLFDLNLDVPRVSRMNQGAPRWGTP